MYEKYGSVHVSDNIVFSCYCGNKSEAETCQSTMNVSFEINIPSELGAR